MVVLVTISNGVRSKDFKVKTAAGLLPSVRTEFGEGTVTDPKGVALTSEYGDLEEGVYVWSSGGEKTQQNDPCMPPRYQMRLQYFACLNRIPYIFALHHTGCHSVANHSFIFVGMIVHC